MWLNFFNELRNHQLRHEKGHSKKQKRFKNRIPFYWEHQAEAKFYQEQKFNKNKFFNIVNKWFLAETHEIYFQISSFNLSYCALELN